MEIAFKTDEKFAFREETPSIVEDYIFLNTGYYPTGYKQPESGNEKDAWKLITYEKRKTSNDSLRLRISSTLNQDTGYSSHTMQIGDDLLMREIRLDNQNYVISDSIVDFFFNPMCPIKFATQNNREHKQKLENYLGQEHTFVNVEDETEIFQNRWLKDEFLSNYLETGKFLSQRYGYKFVIPIPENPVQLVKKNLNEAK